MSERRFPIMGGPSVLWSFVAPYEAQARRNHHQSLEQLAERGGLSPGELWCVVYGLSWIDRPAVEVEAARWLRLLVEAEQTNAHEMARLREVERLMSAYCDACREVDEVSIDTRTGDPVMGPKVSAAMKRRRDAEAALLIHMNTRRAEASR